ncbi:MAG: protein kinase [Mariprofundaceae bacterium]|nr:protein kinase [Mariprofundaceae bacterium]
MNKLAEKLRYYTMMEEVGRGGTGIVYRAKHQKTGHQVAIKLLHDSFIEDSQQIERFHREARIHQKIRHPNILKFIGLYESKQTLAIVMELLQGCSLKQYLQHHGALSTGELLTVMDAVIQSLDVAHRQDVIHRDIKPSNIFLCNDGTIKIMDFGLAKGSQHDDDITKTGLNPVGSYYYMAPEQIIGQPVDARTDLYALGITLFELATGELPFEAKAGGAFEVMEKQVRHRPPELESINPNVDAKLAQIILKLLEKNPQRRFQNCHELASSIHHLSNKTPLTLQGSRAIEQFSDLHEYVEKVPEHVSDIFQKPSTDIKDDLSHETLLWLFQSDSPVASSPPPFDLNSPLPISRQTLNYLRTHITTLPPLPDIWHQVQKVLNQSDSSASDLAKCIEQDPALTAHVLKACNSAAYKTPSSAPITQVALALTRLGMDAAQDIILQEVMPKLGHAHHIQELQAIYCHAQCTASVARILAGYSHVLERHHATLLGMLHDIGKLVILHIESNEKLDLLKESIEQGVPSLKAEWDILGYTHIDAGMMLSLHWKLPRSIHRFIYFHHHPCWHTTDTWPKDLQASLMLIHATHILLSGVLPEMKKNTIWQKNKRSHVSESEKIMQNTLHLPLKDVKFYHHVKQEVLRITHTYPDLFEANNHA